MGAFVTSCTSSASEERCWQPYGRQRAPAANTGKLGLGQEASLACK